MSKKRLLLFSFYLLFFYCSCKNQKIVEPQLNSLNSNSAISVQEAKNFYEKKLKNLRKKTSRNASLNIEKSPRWFEAYQLTNLYRKPQINIPLSFTENQAAYLIKNEQKRVSKRQSDIVQMDLIIYRNENEELEAVVAKSITSEEYLQANSYKINAHNFTGSRIVEDWEGNFITGFQYTNGQITGILNKASHLSKEAEMNCTYIVLDIYYRDCIAGTCTDWTYGGTELLGVSCTIDNALEQVPYEGMVGGWIDGSGRNPNNGLDDIEVEIQDECIKEIVENTLNSNTSIADSTKKHFGIGKKRLVFHQSSTVDALMPITSTGETYISNASVAPPTQSHHINIISIDLNGLALANASQEFIAETAIHEMMHANLYMQGFIGSNDTQHYEMLTNPFYVNQAVNSLQSMFSSLSTEDAKAIFFSGFGKFINGSSENRNLWLQTIRANNLTESFVNSRSEQYRLGQVGTPKCN